MAGMKGIVGAALGALILAALTPALASADTEPNNAVFQPEGPILGEGDISGSVSASDRDDWYVYYVSGVHQLNLTATVPAPCGSIRLTDRDGVPIPSDYTSPAGTTRFYVHAQFTAAFPACDAEDVPYNFRLDPGAGFVQGPGSLPLKTTTEPNDSRLLASGPLAPNAWYFSTLETVNDQDWFAFYTRGGRHQVDVEFVSYGGSCAAKQVTLTDGTGAMLEVARIEPGGPPIVRLRQVTKGGQRLHVHVFGRGGEDCVGAKTAFLVGPDSGAMAAEEVRAACTQGRKATRRWSRRVASDRRALALADRPKPRSLKRRLARDKRKLRAAKRTTRVYCS